MPKEEKKEEITAENTLAPQFGSDTVDLVKGKHDIRRLTKLSPIEIAWLSFFSLEDGVDGADEDLEGGGGYYYEFCNQYENLKTSEEGWRMNKMTQAIGLSKGVSGSVGDIVKRPNIIARNTTQKDWREKAERDGKQTIE